MVHKGMCACMCTWACVCTWHVCTDNLSYSFHVAPLPLPAWEDPFGVVLGLWLCAHAQALSSLLFID